MSVVKESEQVISYKRRCCLFTHHPFAVGKRAKGGGRNGTRSRLEDGLRGVRVGVGVKGHE